MSRLSSTEEDSEEDIPTIIRPPVPQQPKPPTGLLQTPRSNRGLNVPAGISPVTKLFAQLDSFSESLSSTSGNTQDTESSNKAASQQKTTTVSQPVHPTARIRKKKDETVRNRVPKVKASPLPKEPVQTLEPQTPRKSRVYSERHSSPSNSDDLPTTITELLRKSPRKSKEHASPRFSKEKSHPLYLEDEEEPNAPRTPKKTTSRNLNEATSRPCSPSPMRPIRATKGLTTLGNSGSQTVKKISEHDLEVISISSDSEGDNLLSSRMQPSVPQKSNISTESRKSSSSSSSSSFGLKPLDFARNKNKSKSGEFPN